MEKNLTSGSVLKSILFFSLPYLLSYFLQTLYGMADLFIIGQFEGVASTTAVSIGSQVMHMITVMIVGLAMGATVTIGQAVGAQHVLHNVDVGADVEGVAGKQLIQLRLKCLDQRVHRLLNAVLGLRDILALDALLVKLGVGIEQL